MSVDGRWQSRVPRSFSRSLPRATPEVSETRPSVVILAGPNGAGKSTPAPALLHGALGVDEFVIADVIASGLSAFDKA